MALYIKMTAGTTAAQLLQKIKKEITDKKIDTWQYEPTTGFVHATSDNIWNKGGYLVQEVQSDPQILCLLVKYKEGSTVTDGTYGVLNGRFTGMLLNHFSTLIEDIRAVDQRNTKS